MRCMPFFVLLMLFPAILFAATLAKPVYLVALHAKPALLHSHFTFIMTKQTTGRIATFENPDRVVVELKNAHAEFDIEDLALNNANVSAIESESLPNHNLRFIFFTKMKVRAKARFSADHKLILEVISLPVAKKTNPSWMPAGVYPVMLQNGAGKTISTAQTRTSKTTTIVIDAGHGGSDPGARGARGHLEKNVVLQIAKRLALKLNHTKNIRVTMTRTQDHFVPLRERLTLARKSKADLFIAIHADGYFNREARGASVYALSAHGATSEAAHWLAKQDNYSELGGVELNALKDKSPILRKVLIDLAQTATIKASLILGNDILQSLDDIATLHHKSVEQAPFLVLKSPDIPSILIETGFISNPQEERQLANPFYQNKIAQALAQGILQYIKKL